ncbi:hypothetical protein ATANTOWER_001320, partial [Ataeniobius toweri]|nr:hypothetical protein [Ataeniobius toweri]
VFHGQLTHRTTCLVCQTETDSEGPFWHLPLDLEESSGNYSVENGIKMFFTPTIFDGENQMYCDNCDVKVDATRKYVIIHHPDVLLLMLKRFDFSYKHMSYIKINCYANVPHTLRVPENQTYELYAVVEHCGDLRGGHYKAIIRPKDEEVQWYVFDDTNVTPLGQNPFPDNVNIVNSKDAYLLFYRKKDVLLLMLKRFDFSYKHMSHIKINCDANVPHTLKVPENQTYELYAVVEHCVDLRGGHYKAIIRPKDEEVQWYVFDDTNVMPLGQNPFPDNVNIAISRDAYLLFYKKKDAISSATCVLSERTSMTARSDSVETESASLFCAGAASGSSAVSTVNQGPGPEAPVAPHFQAQQCFGPWTANRRGSTSSSTADSNPSDTSGLCQDEPTAHASSNYTTHLSMMSNVSDLCSDDEEMNHAILASIETHLSETSSKSLPVKDILKELSKNINTGMHCKFNISRSAVLDGAIREFKRVSYNPHLSMNVKFSDDFGKNEEAVDLGGPRREFLRLLIEALSMSPMFEGPVKSKDLAMNSTGLF